MVGFNFIQKKEFMAIYLACPDGRRWLRSLPEPRKGDCGHEDEVAVPCRRKVGHKGLHTWEKHAVEHNIFSRFLRKV
jgi:hypothetical protein